MLLAYRTELGWIDPCPIPIVAALNGVALGGGLELALMCDLRIAAAHAEMGLPETSLAIIPGAGGTQRLPQIIGEGRAKELVLLGSRVSAAEALALGVETIVIPQSDSTFLGQNCQDGFPAEETTHDGAGYRLHSEIEGQFGCFRQSAPSIS